MHEESPGVTRSSWQRAADFAARAHQHQVRKDGRTPYAAHPFRVAMTIRHVFDIDDEATLTASLLHDTIEDCDVDFDEIEASFGEEVATLVSLMSKDMRLAEEKREQAYDEQLARGSWKARLIKLADVYDNMSDAGTGGASITGMLEKAHRAVSLAEGDDHLAGARETVKSLMAQLAQARE